MAFKVENAAFDPVVQGILWIGPATVLREVSLNKNVDRDTVAYRLESHFCGAVEVTGEPPSFASDTTVLIAGQ